MNTVRDLRCPDGHYECSVFYNNSDAPPVCPQLVFTNTSPNRVQPCGKPRTTFYATREMEGKERNDKLDASLAQFGTVRFEGQNLTRSELEARKNAYADQQGVPRESLDFAPMGNKGERADFHRHRAYVNRRRVGFDEQQFAEYKREQRQQH